MNMNMNMNMNYFMMLYDDRNINDGAWFDKFDVFEFPDYMFNKCVSLKDKISADFILEMNKEDPEGRVLYDMADNIIQLLIISEPFKELLQNYDCGDVEFLPVSIKNQRDKIEKEKYYIVNLVDSVDYIDTEKSTIKYRAMDESVIFKVKNLSMKEISKSIDLFRADYYPKRYVVSEDLKNKNEDDELEGMKFIPIDEFNSAIHK